MERVPAVGHGELCNGAEVGRWRIAKLIGRGGSSTVYEVRDAGSVGAAMKVMRHEFSTHSALAGRFVREAATVAALDHPCVPRVLEQGRLPDGRVYLVMELLQGRTLAAAMGEQRIALADAADVLMQLCAVLEVAHARGVVHRDLKPENVFLVSETAPVHIKLVDWGIAKDLGLDAERTALTQTGTIVGTPRYLAPEQARSLPVDTRVDIYALGLIAYELLAGFYPFEADSVAETLMLQMVKPPPSPRRFWPDIPSALERTLLAMLAKDPDRRPQLDAIQRVFGALRSACLPEPTAGFRTGEYDGVTTSVDDRPGRPTVRASRLSRP